MTRDNCPGCDVSLIGDPIPNDIAHMYGGTHWRRDIMIEVRGVYDGGLYFVCPDCDHAWPRWIGPEHYLAGLSAEYADRHNAGRVTP